MNSVSSCLVDNFNIYNQVSFQPIQQKPILTSERNSNPSLIGSANKTQEVFNHNLPIVISGAGIAGLTLANALNDMNKSLDPSRKVTYVIIEREKDPKTRNQGYGLSLLERYRVVYKSHSCRA